MVYQLDQLRPQTNEICHHFSQIHQTRLMEDQIECLLIPFEDDVVPFAKQVEITLFLTWVQLRCLRTLLKLIGRLFDQTNSNYMDLGDRFLAKNCGPDIVINGKTVTYSKGSWNVAYGDVIVDGSKYPNGIYEWTLQPKVVMK